MKFSQAFLTYGEEDFRISYFKSANHEYFKCNIFVIFRKKYFINGKAVFFCFKGDNSLILVARTLAQIVEKSLCPEEFGESKF